jgi:hypothetical protein
MEVMANAPQTETLTLEVKIRFDVADTLDEIAARYSEAADKLRSHA